MKYTTKKFISLFLCFIVFFQPIIFNCALYAKDTVVFQDENGNAVSGSEINSQLDSSASTVSENQNGRVGSYMADEEASEIDKATASQKTEEANENLSELNNVSTSDIGANKEAANKATAQQNNNSVGALTSLTAAIQKVLIKIGEVLIKIGDILKKVGKALQAIGAVLSAIPWTAAIGQALQKVGKILYQVGTVVEAVGKVIKATGEAAAGSDSSFGSLLGGIGDAVKTGWKKGGEEADAYNKELNDKFSNTDTSTSQEDSSVETENTESETTSDADQGDVADY